MYSDIYFDGQYYLGVQQQSFKCCHNLFSGFRQGINGKSTYDLNEAWVEEGC